MKKTILLGFFYSSLLLPFLCFSQQSVYDSLVQQLDVHKTKDTIRVKLFVNSSWRGMHTDAKKALEYAQEGIKLATEIKWQQGIVFGLRQEGTVYYYLADYLKALESFQEALKANKELNDKMLAASIYNNIGNIHADLKQNEKAIENFEKLLKISREENKSAYILMSLSNIGTVYTDVNQPNKALPYLQEGLQISKKDKDTYSEAAILANIGLAYEKMAKDSVALDYFTKAKKLAVEIGNKYIQASALNSIGKINFKHGNYKLAEENASKALVLSKESGALEWQAGSWDVLHKIYEKKGQNIEALSAFKKHILLRDSILNDENKTEITRKEMQFKMQNQSELAEAEIGRQRLIKNITFAGGGLLFLAAVGGYFMYKRKRDATEEAKIADFKTKVAETELKALRSQMNPHFIFNSLNSISDYMDKNDVDTANEYLIKFSKLTRAILENSEKKWVPLKEDLELLDLYMQLESLRLPNKLSHSFVIDEHLDPENTMVPPLMLQPFVENSIWHGIAKKDGSGSIIITVAKEGESIILKVDDDGVGRSNKTENEEGKTSLGLKITKSRLEVINALKKAKGAIKIIDKPVGVQVVLELPLELRF